MSTGKEFSIERSSARTILNCSTIYGGFVLDFKCHYLLQSLRMTVPILGIVAPSFRGKFLSCLTRINNVLNSDLQLY